MTFLCPIISKISRITLKMVAIFVKWPPKWRIHWHDVFDNAFSGINAPQNYVESTLKALRLLVSEIDVSPWKWPPFCKMASQCQIEWCGTCPNTFSEIYASQNIYTVKVDGSAPLCF